MARLPPEKFRSRRSGKSALSSAGGTKVVFGPTGESGYNFLNPGSTRDPLATPGLKMTIRGGSGPSSHGL
jgi:hypothetical protein